jgi:hypothetical protein
MLLRAPAAVKLRGLVSASLGRGHERRVLSLYAGVSDSRAAASTISSSRSAIDQWL